MSKKAELPAETQCKNDILRSIYKRQFQELSSLRKYIYSQLPFANVNSIFEPGCGSGLLGLELQKLTGAVYSGMDIDKDILPDREGFTPGDAEKHPQPADIYVTSFFFSSLNNPLKWLKKVRKNLPSKGLIVVFAEYDYSRIGEFPDKGLVNLLKQGLEKDKINTTYGSILDSLFLQSGFTKITGGKINGSPKKPDRKFLKMHLNSLPELLPDMSWCIVWGVWRKS